jgi:hypothetical protein
MSAVDGWFVPRSALTDLATEALERLIADAKQSHIADVKLRFGGKDAWPSGGLDQVSPPCG